jgi:hypothetical protein
VGEELELGEVGYAAYGEAADWKTFDGRDMPAWDDLGERVQGLWNTAAYAIIACEYERRAADAIADAVKPRIKPE